MTLFEYFTSLAPEGETALIVKQIDTGKLHADGTPRYTWPAYMPSHKQRKGESWFINTGSFIIDRFKNGKPSASVANCTHVLFMMLDDIGTKSKTPPLAPTAIVETSPGNFQYWYAYSDQPTVEQHCAALSAIARAGYTDPGATNAVRNCRLPGSVNQKPGREAFECREVEFSKLEYTLEEICAALGVTPDEESSRANHLRLTDTGNDDVLAWLNEQGLVTSRVNSEGWCGVVCPNHAEHTDGQLEARYMPQSRAFCCYHGHCEHLDSNYFCDWVAEQGGPKHRPGIREELIAEAMKPLSSLKPTKANPDVAAQIVAETERKQAGRESRSEWHDRFAYIISDDAYFDKYTCSEISRKAFNALFKGVECVISNSEGKKRRIEASAWFDTFREDKGAYALHGLTYAAGEDWMVTKDGLVYGNMWRDARPEIKGPTGDPQQWIDHCRRLVPDERELEHIWDVMAYKAQHPDVKINHAILHGGKGGCGKDTMWAPFIWSVCGPHEKNKGLIDNDSLTSQWGYQLESEIVVLNELKEPNAADRRALANKLKPIIAAPPETLVINRKGLHPYQMVNRLFMLAFTNEDMPITLDSDDRRWFCVWSDAPKMTPGEAQAMWGWYHKGGFEAVTGWLRARDVSKFNPQAIPPMTEYKAKLVYVGMSNAESHVYHMIEKGEAPFNVDVISGPWHTILDKLNETVNNATRVVRPALFHALKEAGWVDKGLCYSSDLPSKKHCFVKPCMADWNRSDVRRKLAEITGELKDKENVVSLAERVSNIPKASG
jgi:hypothetical protein